MLRALPLLAAFALAGCLGASSCPPLSFAPAPDQKTSAYAVASLDEAGLVVERGEGVPDAPFDAVVGGVALQGRYFAEVLGGDIPAEAKREFLLKVVATGESPPGYPPGVCCVGGAQIGNRTGIYFDVSNSKDGSPTGLWDPFVGLQRIGAHEYVHLWQKATGCLHGDGPVLNRWMSEGMADYLSFGMQVAYGYSSANQAYGFNAMGPRFDGAYNHTLAELSGNSTPVFPGAIGYLAFHDLAEKTGKGPRAVADFCRNLAGAASVDEAFEATFGLSLEAFEREWNGRRAALLEMALATDPRDPRTQAACDP